MPNARFAAIDVGSNAIRMRIIEAPAPLVERDASQLALYDPDEDDGHGWKEITNLRAPVRLGSEVFMSGRLTPASIGQACAALREFRTKMDDARVDAYRATATSAVREASNGATLVERALRESGIELEVIEGIEEARLIELAVVRKLAIGKRRALLIDVGGGSTELTVLDDAHHSFSMSLPIGTVRMLEMAKPDSERPFDKRRVQLLFEIVERAIAEALPQLKKTSFEIVVGTGGNIETLADLAPAKDVRGVNAAAMRTLFSKMAKMSADDRKSHFGLRPDRADTIVPATAIFLRLAEELGIQTIVAPGVGLKEGMLVEIVDKHYNVWDVEAEAQNVLMACARLGHRYHFDEAHGQHVARLAMQLFDDLREVHSYGERERLLLRAGALLHDIGDFVRYDGHHKHSHYLIQSSDIFGLRPDERAIVANIARYHRKSFPDPSHQNFRELDKEARGKVRALAAILRIADALDREHLGKVKSVRAVVEKNKRIVLSVTGEEDRALEEWTVQAKAQLLRDVFDLDVSFAEEKRRSDVPATRAS